ncbi:MAG TPA: hypothetical protein PKY60_13105 [Thermoflexales bacterium]|nr:hypothetical protein [Thermoflexales bacterium]
MTSPDSEAQLPSWEELLGAQGYRIFIKLVRAYFAQHGLPIELDETQGILLSETEQGTTQSTYGLQNLAQVCGQADRDEWRDLITRHFDAILDAQKNIADETKASTDFAALKPFLRARIFPEDVAKHTDELIYRRGPPGTIETLALDNPIAVRTIARSETREWDLSDTELLRIGRQNLLDQGLLRPERVQVEAGSDLYVYTGDPYYAASHVLLLDEYLPDVLPNGALIGIPRRDLFVAHYIRNPGALEVISAMIQLIIGLYREGPGSISANLFWFWRGAFIQLPYEIKDDELDFEPPDEFVDMLDDLTAGVSLS